MAFHNVILPVSVSFGSGGGPEFRTDIAVLGSGHEQRNAIWANPRNRYNAGYGVQSVDDIYKVEAFWLARRGPLHSFRFRDPTDYKTCKPSSEIRPTDQEIGTGDGATREFQLWRSYGDKINPYRRKILTPRPSSVRIAVNGVEKVSGSDFAVSHIGGLITFTAPPADGATVTAGFYHDIPVRFESDSLKKNLATYLGGEIPDIPMIEVRVLL